MTDPARPVLWEDPDRLPHNARPDPTVNSELTVRSPLTVPSQEKTMPEQPGDRGICGARTEPAGLLRAAVCELLHGHPGWHRNGGMSWTEGPDESPRAFTQADVDAAYQRGLTEGRRQAAEGKTLVVEWGARVDEPHPRRREKPGDVIKLDEDAARYAPTIWEGWTTVRRERLVGPWEPAEQPEPARGGIIASRGPTIVAEDGCGLTWPPGYSPAEKLASLHRQPHGGSCRCRECYDDDPFAAQRLVNAEDPGERVVVEQPEGGTR